MTLSPFSFEFFPPKTPEAEKTLYETAQTLANFNPAFMTVTYGAGGSTRDKTLEIVTSIKDKTNVPMAAHLTSLCTSKDEIKDIADSLWENNIRHIVALRGDQPKDPALQAHAEGKEQYRYANELVEGLKKLHDFEISVAAYPEKHPQASDLDTDIENLKRKCDAGADRAITQFFFDNDVYYRFLDKVGAANITIPVVPGLLPVLNFSSMVSFAKKCEANVPDWLHKKFEGLEDKPDDAQKIAADILQKQIADLQKKGVPHIHIYTLNKSDILSDVLQTFRKAA